MKALKSASFFALSRSLRMNAYVTAAPAAAPSKVPKMCVAAPLPASDFVVASGTGATVGAEALLAILGAFGTAGSAGSAGSAVGATGIAPLLEAHVWALKTLGLSRKLCETVLCHVMTLLCSIMVPSFLISGPFRYTTSMLLPSKSSTAALK
jgi:hypothetical protein